MASEWQGTDDREDFNWPAFLKEIESYERDMQYKELLQEESRKSFRKSLENMRSANASMCETKVEIKAPRMPTAADQQINSHGRNNALEILKYDKVGTAIDAEIKAKFENFRKSIEPVQVEHSRTENQDDGRKKGVIPKKLKPARQLEKLSVPAKSLHRVIVSNLRSRVTRNDIEILFGDFGELFEARLTEHGWAEVIFKSLNDAERAIEAYHNRLLDGQLIQCHLEASPTTFEDVLVNRFEKLSVKNSEPVSDYRIVVSNLHSRVTQDDIEELFAEIGELREARLITPGLAEVVYKRDEHAQKAVETFLNQILDGRPIKCWLASYN